MQFSKTNIINLFKQHSNTDDILKLVFGISSSEHFDCVFVAPTWNINKVFDPAQVHMELLFQSLDIIAHKIVHNNKKYLYAQLKLGAPNVMDFCLSCNALKCDKFVFVGSAGSLVPEIGLGDIIIPKYSISGDGASLYLHNKLNPNNMFKKAFSCPVLNRQLQNICKQQNIKTVKGIPISVDSILCEYQHLAEFKKMGANAIEMETSAFFNSMKLINKAAAAILIISDNSSVGQHLIDAGKEAKNIYHSARSRLKDILLNI